MEETTILVFVSATKISSSVTASKHHDVLFSKKIYKLGINTKILEVEKPRERKTKMIHYYKKKYHDNVS